MKKIIFILSLLFIFTACDNEEQPASPVIEAATQDSILVYKGNFIAAGNEAVFKGDQFIFEVVMDSTAKSLRDSLRNDSRSPNIHPVVLKGKVTNNQMAGGYSQVIEIIEILEIPEKVTPIN